ncbi:hypothetical protein ABET11_23685 [Priestia megaterium]|jgi:hypothetical protein|uniref:hypothetical protein n=1 Tax=Priestia megaterium TaxID=1404 RepID=UPI000BF71AFD|nr:hypothetical protein [Priestia megaterium]MDD9795670.1 hypothetical protein [Priestia megaterium]MDH3177844.1 hypothetical protein [Priestia megaterium]PFL61055.1 hypothetical protein COJ36_26760 [Priestia megaterium]
MNIRKTAITIGVLSLTVGTGLYISSATEKNIDTKAEIKAKTDSQEALARKKVEELNSKVASGEEKVLSQSAVFPDVNKEEAFQEADIVIKGKVESINKEYMENTDIPFTDFNFNVEEYWKSDLKEEENNSIKQLVVTQDGNSDLNFNEHPLMEVNKEYILFLKRVLNNNNEEKLIMIAGPNGKFNLNENVIDQSIDTQSVNGETADEFIEDSSQGEVNEPIAEIITK